MLALRREAGSSSLSCFSRVAFFTRFTKSAIGSVMLIIDILCLSSPARLRHARQLTLEGQATETQAAHVEFTHERARPAAERATVADANRELELFSNFLSFRLSRQFPV